MKSFPNLLTVDDEEVSLSLVENPERTRKRVNRKIL